MKTYLIAISLFGIAIITTAIKPSIAYALKNLITLINKQLKNGKLKTKLLAKCRENQWKNGNDGFIRIGSKLWSFWLDHSRYFLK